MHVDVIRLRLQGGAFPDRIDRAELIIDEIGLLRRLVKALSEPIDHGFNFGELSSKVFHPDQCSIGSVELPKDIRDEELGEKRPVLQQALGSDVTFIWGPPGTGKTFVIARLIIALIRTGERVLVTSHTKAAVDQALYEVTKPGASLAESVEFSRGEILRIGKVPETANLPPEVQLDHVLEQRSKGLLEQKAAIETQAKPLRERESYCRQVLGAWNNLTALAEKTRDIPVRIHEARTQIDLTNKKLLEDQNNV